MSFSLLFVLAIFSLTLGAFHFSKVETVSN